MPKSSRLFIATLLVILTAIPSAWAIQRTAPRLNVVSFSGGYAGPVGTYDGTVALDFDFDGTLVDFDAKNVYENGVRLAISYGAVKRGHWLGTLGFEYTRHNYKNPLVQRHSNHLYEITFLEDPAFSQYDLELSLGYLFNDLNYTVWSPLFGFRLTAGMSGISAERVESEYQSSLSLGLDFGADIKIWTAPDKRSFVTLSSVNSWDFAASNDRPRYLNIGAGIKYYFRP
ncbi:MAG: hypothetical protein DRP45_08385 [Candidatus Zixiibacteriota bacterium]|nr:MAG: hypothetical protein DRP45_08385 [candidate division Zixibacteria bacterium]